MRREGLDADAVAAPLEPGAEPEKVRVAGTCPECGAAALFEYPVLATGGWFRVVKCQSCLASVSRVPWNRLGWISLPEDAL
jgi:hypothetical protein